MAHSGATVAIKRAREAGSCNFCDGQVDTVNWGIKDEPVAVLMPAYSRGSGGVTVRVCQECARDIVPRLAHFAKL